MHLNVLIFRLGVFQFCSQSVDLTLRFLNLGMGNKKIPSILTKEIQMSTVGRDLNLAQLKIEKFALILRQKRLYKKGY